MNRIIKNVAILLTVLSLHSCEKLALQKSFHFDANDHPAVIPPFNITIYEFMMQHVEFDSMTAAVKRAGMEDIFKGGEDDKTVLLLRNEAMKKFLNDYGFSKISDVPIMKLQNLLKYHVITTRFTQQDLSVQTFYVFHTLIDGDDGFINIWKFREYWTIRINSGGPDLPKTAKGADVYLHNYEFTNGVVHQMKQYVQRVPF